MAAPVGPDPGQGPDPSVLLDPARVAASAALIAAGPLSDSAQRLVDLTASLLGTPYAQINLLADVQVVAVGHGTQALARVSPLDESVCSRTVASGEIVAIEDAAGSADLSCLSAVADGMVGNYLGAPLRDGEGHVVGALCAFGPGTRVWSERDRSILAALAVTVSGELVLSTPTSTDPAALDGVDQLHGGQALSSADIGSFQLDPTTGTIAGDAQFLDFFGFAGLATPNQLPAFLDRIHHEDRDRVVAELEQAMTTLGGYQVEHRVCLPGGEVRWLSVRGRVLPDMLGRPRRMSGIVYDTTTLRRSRDQMARLLETMTDAFFRLDRAWAFTYVNGEAERILGRRRADLLGRDMWEAFPEAVGSQFHQQYERAVSSGIAVSFEDYFPPMGMWYEVRATPDADGLSVFFHDVSDRKRAEHQRELANGRLALLAEVTLMMAATLDADVALERLAALLVPTFADWAVITQQDEDGTVRPAGHRHGGGRDEELAALAQAAIGIAADVQTAQVLAGGPPVLLDAVPSALVDRAATDVPGLADELHGSSYLIVPLTARGRVLGSIALVATLPRWFSQEDLDVATDLGRRAGLSVDNARLYAQARTAQALAESSSARLSLVAEVTRSMNSTLDTQEAMRRLLSLVVTRMADWASVVLLDDEGRMLDSAVRHRDSARAPAAEAFAGLHLGLPHEASHLAQVTRSGEALLVRHAAPGIEAAPVDRPEAVRLVERLGLASLVAVPLQVRDRILGVLLLARDDDSPRYGDEDLATAADLGRRAGLSLENAQLYSRQRKAAEVLQRSLLTRLPEPTHLEIVARYLPAAEEAQVGGDWYDAFLQPGGSTVLAIGDVVGHDMGAAAAMGQLRNLLRGTAYDREDTPSHVLSRVDAAIRGLQVDTLATAIIGRIEQTAEDRAAGRRRVRWSNAGHPPPMLLEADGQVTMLDTEADLLLGLDPHTSRQDHEAVLEEGATLLFYTDGLVERRDSPLDAGLTRLRQALGALSGLPLEQLCDELLVRLLPGEADDDVALVAVRTHPEGRPRPPGIAAPRVPDLVRADLVGSDESEQEVERATVPHVTHLHLRGHPTDVAAARQFLRNTAALWRLPRDAVDTAVLVLSEVVTNAVRYAAGPIDVTMTHSAGVLRVDVADSAHDLGPRRPPATVELLRPDAEGGRGLFLVEALSQRWGTTSVSGDGKLVWFEITV